MKKNSLQIIALVILVIYSALAISPLAAIAAKSPVIAFAVTEECSGECATCGCSPESTAARTCCCWQKKMKHHGNRNEKSLESSKITEAAAGVPVLSTCKCGGNKILAFWGENDSQLLPDHFTVSICQFENPLVCHEPKLLTSRFSEPPEQPPKLSSHS